MVLGGGGVAVVEWLVVLTGDEKVASRGCLLRSVRWSEIDDLGKKTKGREGERLAGGGDDGGFRQLIGRWSPPPPDIYCSIACAREEGKKYAPL